MNNKLENNIGIARKYLAYLEAELAVSEKELTKKVEPSKRILSKDAREINERIRTLKSVIASLEKSINEIEELDGCDQALKSLSGKKTDDSFIYFLGIEDELLDKLTSLYCKKSEEDFVIELIEENKDKLTEFLKQEKDAKKKIDREIAEKKDSKGILSKRKIKELEVQSKEHAETIEGIENWQKRKNEINKSITKLGDPAVSEKEKKSIYKEYSDIIENALSDEKNNFVIIISMDDFEENFKKWFAEKYPSRKYEAFIESFNTKIIKEDELEEQFKKAKKAKKAKKREETKTTLQKVGEALDNHKKVIITVGGLVIILTSVLVAAKSCSKNNNNTLKNDPDNLDDDKSYSDGADEDSLQNEAITYLMNSGYSESEAQETINNIIATYKTLGYSESEALDAAIEEIKNSIKYVNGYNPEHSAMYKFAIDNYALTNEKAVDFVERAYEIKDINLFGNDYAVDDILKILVAIDNKTITKSENAELLGAFDTVANKIAGCKLQGNTIDDYTQEESLAIYADQLKNGFELLATEGSDLDKYFTNYGTLLENILKDPDNLENINTLISYSMITATSYGGNNNDKTVLTADSTFNSNATIDNQLDLAFAIQIWKKFLPICNPLPATYDTQNLEDKIAKIDMSDQLDQSEGAVYKYIISNYDSSMSLQNLFNEKEFIYLWLKYEESIFNSLTGQICEVTVVINEPVQSYIIGTSTLNGKRVTIYSDYVPDNYENENGYSRTRSL